MKKPLIALMVAVAAVALALVLSAEMGTALGNGSPYTVLSGGTPLDLTLSDLAAGHDTRGVGVAELDSAVDGPIKFTITSFDWSVTDTNTGRVGISPVQLDKRVDGTTPELVQLALQNGAINTGTIRIYKVGTNGEQSVLLEMKLRDATISGSEILDTGSGPSGGIQRLMISGRSGSITVEKSTASW